MCKVCSSLGQKWGNGRAITGINIILTCSFSVYLLKESTTSLKDLDKLVTNIPQMIEYGDFCQTMSTSINCIFEELLSFRSVAFKWEQSI